ncbi:hypothetical protein MBM_09396 [Drepanopeziza brunnea f. sp. 'multigermtubi' MB_m1]|uniref:Uncharacterized protein n=1 Tax=Marssonina brunnea f. sp. multigermtubi (strain MB_m1) TaxID=1072389 RepID=K1WJG2_MARBU|nr:uncharacterized protein MBM_09396 [Drepanopeziza brunnea f. sp. 'multigermtubi' MB_m1]EKD12362.1 hypothetical protein MBM_09396 [Drepanopeziza brunnea f. sp. 'multigermtubi' MB_m1]
MLKSYLRLVLSVLLPLAPFHLATALPFHPISRRGTPWEVPGRQASPATRPTTTITKTPNSVPIPSPPSQNPLFENKQLSSFDEHLAYFGTIHAPSFAPMLTPPLHINFFMSSGTCQPLSASLLLLLSDVSEALLSTDLSLIPRRSLLPVYVTASINEQIHFEVFVLSLSAVVEPFGLESVEKGMDFYGGTERWRGIVRLLERGALELDTAARKRDGRGLESILVLEIEVAP